jgi:hypothetical protein
MNALRWRIALSLGNLLSAITMSLVGEHQYERDRRAHPNYSYRASGLYQPTAQSASYCLNIPPFAVSNLFLNFAMSRQVLPPSWWDVNCFYFVRYEFYVGLFFFWWWVGWKVDLKLASRNTRRTWKIVESSLGIVLALLLLTDGGIEAWSDYSVHATAWAMVAWGAALLYYFLFELWPFKVVPAQIKLTS